MHRLGAPRRPGLRHPPPRRPDQAVYAFAREELDWWAAELGDELRDGEFGENLTTEGLAVDDAELGERWRIGTVLLEVASVRTPCQDFKVWMGRGGHDNKAWVRRFTEHGRPGAYLRVLQEGVLQAGDPIEVVHRPGHGVTMRTAFRAVMGEPALLPGLLVVDGLASKLRPACRGGGRDDSLPVGRGCELGYSATFAPTGLGLTSQE